MIPVLLPLSKADFDPLFAFPHRKPMDLSHFFLAARPFPSSSSLVHAFLIFFLSGLAVDKKTRLLVFTTLAVCD